MKKLLFVVAAMLSMFVISGCSKVPAGHVGVKVYLLGGAKGVDHETLGVGRYYIGINEELYLFPVFEQNPKYSTSDDDSGDPLVFQTREGMQVTADVAVTYRIEPDNVAAVFQKYRLGIREINQGPIRNMVRDALNEVASKLSVEAVYGEGKVKMIDDVEALVAERAQKNGITVTQISLLGAMRLPDTVVKALNAKIEATQRAQQRENELREAEAQAKKVVAEAEGEALKQKALAEGEASATLTRAKSQAEANRILSQSLTRELIDYEKAKRWDGKLPQVSGNVTPMMQISQ